MTADETLDTFSGGMEPGAFSPVTSSAGAGDVTA